MKGGEHMWVRVIKASKPSYWYAGRIGSTFEVTYMKDNIYMVKKWKEDYYAVDIAPILKTDCEDILSKNYPNENIVRGRKEVLSQRSAFNTFKEIERYEALNKTAEVKLTKNIKSI
ncbi:hypothetical protein QD47_28660 [Paenibacillus terrae]|uniref:Uncharacterized protein n=2 Tax=Paenibacillus terrae TaxID=159743 RepID=A0A0D7WX90_9BACL|nr:hypothetical protein QD47_28660 [Paenibacillus terrae]